MERLGTAPFWAVELVGGAYLGVQYGVLVAVVGILSLAGIVGIAATVTAPLRQRDEARKFAEALIPKLELDFDPNLGGIIETPEKIRNPDGTTQEYDATYVRIRVKTKSKKAVHSCSAFLINVEKKNGNGDFEKTDFIDPIQLPWSLLRAEPVDIPYLITRSVDVVFSTTRNNNELDFRGTWPLTLRQFFRDHTTYRLTVLVCGDDVAETITIDVHWDGNRENINAERIL
jgi:hypothetical protein